MYSHGRAILGYGPYYIPSPHILTLDKVSLKTKVKLEKLVLSFPLSEVIGQIVTWDHHKSDPKVGKMWTPCPFHEEKQCYFHSNDHMVQRIVDRIYMKRSSSFLYDDHKKIYYCSECKVKGDAIDFIAKVKNINRTEAINEILNNFPDIKKSLKLLEEY